MSSTFSALARLAKSQSASVCRRCRRRRSLAADRVAAYRNAYIAPTHLLPPLRLPVPTHHRLRRQRLLRPAQRAARRVVPLLLRRAVRRAVRRRWCRVAVRKRLRPTRQRRLLRQPITVGRPRRRATTFTHNNNNRPKRHHHNNRHRSSSRSSLAPVLLPMRSTLPKMRRTTMMTM